MGQAPESPAPRYQPGDRASPQLLRRPLLPSSPSGAFVFFSVASSLVDCWSGAKTDTSSLLNPAASRASTPFSAPVRVLKIPNAAVFFPAISHPFTAECALRFGSGFYLLELVVLVPLIEIWLVTFPAPATSTALASILFFS